MSQSVLGLTPKEKKEYIKRIIANGDTRTYNSAMADLELKIWKEKRGDIPKNN